MQAEVSTNVFVQASSVIDSLAGYGTLNANPFLSESQRPGSIVSQLPALCYSKPRFLQSPRYSLLGQEQPLLFTPLLSGLQSNSLHLYWLQRPLSLKLSPALVLSVCPPS